jgi:hypothetical protein
VAIIIVRKIIRSILSHDVNIVNGTSSLGNYPCPVETEQGYTAKGFPTPWKPAMRNMKKDKVLAETFLLDSVPEVRRHGLP